MLFNIVYKNWILASFLLAFNLSHSCECIDESPRVFLTSNTAEYTVFYGKIIDTGKPFSDSSYALIEVLDFIWKSIDEDTILITNSDYNNCEFQIKDLGTGYMGIFKLSQDQAGNSVVLTGHICSLDILEVKNGFVHGPVYNTQTIKRSYQDFKTSLRSRLKNND